jgi:hypothetical protein
VKSEKGTIASSAGVGPTPADQIELQQQMLLAMGSIQGADLTQPRRLAALRTLELIFSRLGKPDAESCAAVAAKARSRLPLQRSSHQSRTLPRSSSFSIHQRSHRRPWPSWRPPQTTGNPSPPTAVLLRNEGYANAAFDAAASRPNKQQIALMYALRNATRRLDPRAAQVVLLLVPRARTWKGGNSFRGFIENIRKEALANFAQPPNSPNWMPSPARSEPVAVANFVAPKGPGKNYSVDDVLALTAEGFKGRDFKNGEAMFRSVMCAHLPPLQRRWRRHWPRSHRLRQPLHHARPHGKHRDIPARSSPTNTTATRSSKKTVAWSSGASSSKRTARSSS